MLTACSDGTPAAPRQAVTRPTVDATTPPSHPSHDAATADATHADAATHVADAAPQPTTFRAVFMTDTHVIGPQYACCSESNWVDDDSIEKTVARLTAVRDEVNAITPPPAMVFVMGDVVHAAHVSRDPLWYREHVNAYTIAAQIFGGFHMPVYMAMGNHDYEVDCGSSASYDRSFSEDRFKEFFRADPYTAVDYGGWKFILANSQAGDTFDPMGPKCDQDYGSVGATQMGWIEGQLNEGKPTVVMTHYMRILYEAQEEQGSPYPSFPALLDAHASNIKAFLAGHTHRWLDQTSFNKGVFHWVLGGTRYDANNFWLIEFDSPSGTFKVLDEGKAITDNSCSEPWTYNGVPKAVPHPPVDAGDDCVEGLGN
jgi:hypothetical protein